MPEADIILAVGACEDALIVIVFDNVIAFVFVQRGVNVNRIRVVIRKDNRIAVAKVKPDITNLGVFVLAFERRVNAHVTQNQCVKTAESVESVIATAINISRADTTFSENIIALVVKDSQVDCAVVNGIVTRATCNRNVTAAIIN